MKISLCLCIAACLLGGIHTQAARAQSAATPAPLPGKGLAQHDFFYAGESKLERMFIVRKGEIAWTYTHNGKGEISDATLEPNGNILFAHQFGITEVSPEKKVVWNYDTPPNAEIHTAQPYAAGKVWFVQNSNPAKFAVIDKATGKIEREFNLPVKNPQSIHGHFRFARITEAGTLLAAHMDLGKVAEYNMEGKEVWSFASPGVWSAVPLKNGNILVTGRDVKEVNRKGETVWQWKPSDAPEYKMNSLQKAVRLPNGNTIINNWFNEWSGSGKVDPAKAPVQAIEVTPEKKVVWVLRSWTPPVDLGPSTTIQVLDSTEK